MLLADPPQWRYTVSDEPRKTPQRIPYAATAAKYALEPSAKTTTAQHAADKTGIHLPAEPQSFGAASSAKQHIKRPAGIIFKTSAPLADNIPSVRFAKSLNRSKSRHKMASISLFRLENGRRFKSSQYYEF
jgi:hypothetical protein